MATIIVTDTRIPPAASAAAAAPGRTTQYTPFAIIEWSADSRAVTVQWASTDAQGAWGAIYFADTDRVEIRP